MTLDEMRAAVQVLKEFERVAAGKREGAMARAGGKKKEDNPYPPGSWIRENWEHGWERMDRAVREVV